MGFFSDTASGTGDFVVGTATHAAGDGLKGAKWGVILGGLAGGAMAATLYTLGVAATASAVGTGAGAAWGAMAASAAALGTVAAAAAPFLAFAAVVGLGALAGAAILGPALGLLGVGVGTARGGVTELSEGRKTRRAINSQEQEIEMATSYLRERERAHAREDVAAMRREHQAHAGEHHNRGEGRATNWVETTRRQHTDLGRGA